MHQGNHKWYEAGAGAAVIVRKLVGEPDHQKANHSVEKDHYREADFLGGFLCGLAGICDKKDYFEHCMPDPVPHELKESVDALSEGLMHGGVMDNLILGLFNLDFAMTDFKEALHEYGCYEVAFDHIDEWTTLQHSIDNESMKAMQAKLNEHLDDAHQVSHSMRDAWGIQDYFKAGHYAA